MWQDRFQPVRNCLVGFPSICWKMTTHVHLCLPLGRKTSRRENRDAPSHGVPEILRYSGRCGGGPQRMEALRPEKPAMGERDGRPPEAPLRGRPHPGDVHIETLFKCVSIFTLLLFIAFVSAVCKKIAVECGRQHRCGNLQHQLVRCIACGRIWNCDHNATHSLAPAAREALTRRERPRYLQRNDAALPAGRGTGCERGCRGRGRGGRG